MDQGTVFVREWASLGNSPTSIRGKSGRHSTSGMSQKDAAYLALGDEPKLIPITGTEKAKLPAEKMFFAGKFRAPLGNLTSAIVYYGNAKEIIVPPDK